MMDANTQLDGWVQAKITKAADYIASVYHYLEYEMKFSEYGQAIDDSDVYTESQKRQLKNMLVEAKEKIKDLKKAQAEKLKKKEKKDIEEASGFRASDKKKGKVDKSEKKQYFVKLEKDNRTKGVTMVADEGETEGDIRDRAKRDNQGWTVTSVRAKDTGSGEEVSETFMPVKKSPTSMLDKMKKAANIPGIGGNRPPVVKKGATGDELEKMLDKDVEEGKGDGNLANNAKPYDKITRGDVIAGRLGKDEKGGKKVKESSAKCNESPKGKPCPVHGMKECSMEESIVAEKAVSKAQQKFMGMVHAAKKGEKPASKEVAKTAKGMSAKDAKDFAATKHKGLPEKKDKK